MKRSQQRKRNIQLASAGVFLLFIFGLSLINLFAEKKDFSENENRVLAPLPDASLHNIFFGNFDTQFESWFTDHFVSRDRWIQRKASVRIDLGAIENNGVYLGKDERLIQQFMSYRYDAPDLNISFIEDFSDDVGMPLNILLVPGASTQTQYLPYGSANVDEVALIQEIYEKMPDQNCIDITERIVQEENAYYRTDHHWNEHGALIAYEAICENVLKKDPMNFYYKEVSNSFKGTMFSKSGAFWTKADSIQHIRPAQNNPLTVTFENGKQMDTLFVDERLNEKDQYTYYLDGNHAYLHIHTNKRNDKHAIVIKDSYAHILLPYLVQEYEDVDVFDLRYFTDSVSSYIDSEEKDNTDIYIIYGIETFCTDTNLAILW